MYSSARLARPEARTRPCDDVMAWAKILLNTDVNVG
jgi:hypothetical protein